MRRYRRQRRTLYNIALLLVMPVLMAGVTYALFSQDLTITGVSGKPSYSSTQYTLMTYTKTETPSGSNWSYALTITIKNYGVTQLTGWKIVFVVPAGSVPSFTCPTSVTCTKNATTNTITIVNGTGNGKLNVGASRSFNVSFVTTVARYTLQNVTVSGTYSTAWQTISGLTVTATRGTRTKQGNRYTWPVTITVTNNSGQPLSSWRVLVPWATANTYTPTTPPAGISYTTSSTQLTITSSNVLANNTSYTLTTTPAFSVTSTNANWTTTGTTVQGRP